MTPAQELELFARLNANNPGFKDWLEYQRAAAFKVLTVNTNAPTIHQHQGEVQLIEKMIGLLTNANKILRT